MLQRHALEETTPIGRRAVLVGGFAGAVAYAFSPVSRAATRYVSATTAANRRFSILYKGFEIGSHTVSSAAATGEVRIETEINIEVKIAFVSAYSFHHRSQETWRSGRLMSLDSQTVEHGQPIRVEGAATPQGFRVVSKGGPYIAGASTLTSNSIWTPAMLAQRTVVDAQHGGVIGVSARRTGDELIVIAGSPVRATRYSFITPYYAGSVWYDQANLWVRGEFERDGSMVQYRLET